MSGQEGDIGPKGGTAVVLNGVTMPVEPAREVLHYLERMLSPHECAGAGGLDYTTVERFANFLRVCLPDAK